MLMPLRVFLDRTIRSGSLTFVDPVGHAFVFGDGTGSPVVVRVCGRWTELRLLLYPQLALGEAYMRGQLLLDRGSIYDLLDLILRNVQDRPLSRGMRLGETFRRSWKYLQQYNPALRAQRNVAHHYNIDSTIYDLFLDPDRQYSCAYFDRTADLSAAQRAKKRHIAAKLCLRPGQTVLDIGSGWGGLGLYLAEAGEVRVTGVTLSSEQLKVARERAAASPLSDQVSFDFCDYRAIEGRFDRIVSVGMFEHVGVAHYAAFFNKVAELLSEDGVALIHAIGRFDTPTTTNPFIAKYIFPGGYTPALSEVLPAIERSGLIVTDIEILRLHYAETLRRWRERFIANWAEAEARRGAEFCRMWEFYLAGSETGMRYQKLMVFQIQLAKSLTALPLTRDYIPDAEHRLQAVDPGRPLDEVAPRDARDHAA